MFRPMSNAACNHPINRAATLSLMGGTTHESAARLYAAAKKVGLEGKSAIARVLNESPQSVNNWERRGVSEGGALKAQAAFGCDANWILTGDGSMYAGWPFQNVDLAKIVALDDRQQGYLEGILAGELERISLEPTEADIRSAKASHVQVSKPATKRRAA